MSNYNHGGGPSPAQDRLIVPSERIIEKKTHCGNCIHFTSGPGEFNRWVKDFKVQSAITAIRFEIKRTGLVLQEFDEGDAALKVAKMVGKGMTQDQAIAELQIERTKLARQMLPKFLDIDWADMRLKDWRKTAELIARGVVGFCNNKGVDNAGTEIEFPNAIYSAYHCHKWTGATGWSLAHDADRKLDKLPAEIVRDVNDATPAADKKK